jgi:hypothetical protein
MPITCAWRGFTCTVSRWTKHCGKCAGRPKIAAHHNVPHLYHETITVAWMRLLATHHEPTLQEFLAENESRLGKDLLFRFWSPELLDSTEARAEWTPPDRQSLPTPVRGAESLPT